MKEMAGTSEDGPIPHHPPLPDQLTSNRDHKKKGLRRRQADQMLPAAVPSQHPIQHQQEMENSQNNAEGGNNALDVEMGISRPTPPVENGTSRTASQKRKLDFDLKSSMFLITISMILLTDLFFLNGPTAKLNLILKKVSVFTSFTALIFAFCLMLNTFKLMTIKPEQFIPKSQLRVSKILYSISVAALLLTSISIAYSLLPKAYYFLPIALLPSLLVAVFHFLHGADDTNDNNEEISSAQIKAHKKALKRATQLTMSLVAMSFSGFIGVLFAIYKAASLGLGAAYSDVKVSVYLLLGGGIAGTSAMLLCTLLSGNAAGDRPRSGTTWERTILTAANIVMLVMVVPAILVIAETILHGVLAGAMFPVIAGAATRLLVEFCTEDDDNKVAHGTMYAIAVTVASVSFGLIVAIFAGLLGEAVEVKACTFLLASAFVAAVSLGVVTYGMAWMDKVKASMEFAATVLTCCSLGTLVLAAIALFCQIEA